MNSEAIRHFYAYHFSENRRLWEQSIAPLSDAQFAQESPYSHGSVRDQFLHLVQVDEVWFSDLRGTALTTVDDPAALTDRDEIGAYLTAVEEGVRGYLATLRDEMLTTKPLEGEDRDLRLWQVLLHVVNHGTDHRAQILRLLNDLGVETTSQDYIFYVYGNLV